MRAIVSPGRRLVNRRFRKFLYRFFVDFRFRFCGCNCCLIRPFNSFSLDYGCLFLGAPSLGGVHFLDSGGTSLQSTQIVELGTPN